MKINQKYTWLITGGAGFIGSHIVKQLVKEGQKVIVYDNFSSSSIHALDGIKKSIKIINADILDEKTLNKAAIGVDFILHLAALVSVVQSVQQPALTQQINITGTFNVLQAALQNKVKKFVLSSSSAVYGNNKKAPYTELSLTDCQSPYAVSKLVGEELAKMFCNVYGLPTVSLRYFNVFGPGQSPTSPYAAVIAKFNECAQNGDTFFIDWDGKQTRDFIFVEDIAKANILAALKGKEGQVYNVGSGVKYSLLQLATLIEQQYSKKMQRIFRPKRAGDVKTSVANTTKIQKLGFKPSDTLQSGLKKC